MPLLRAGFESPLGDRGLSESLLLGCSNRVTASINKTGDPESLVGEWETSVSGPEPELSFRRRQQWRLLGVVVGKDEDTFQEMGPQISP